MLTMVLLHNFCTTIIALPPLDKARKGGVPLWANYCFLPRHSIAYVKGYFKYSLFYVFIRKPLFYFINFVIIFYMLVNVITIEFSFILFGVVRVVNNV